MMSPAPAFSHCPDSPSIPPPGALSDWRLAGVVGGMTYASAAKRRVYVDTSVIGGCEDDEFRDPSRRLMRRFARGDLAIVLSPFTIRELNSAPESVRVALNAIPQEHVERIQPSSRFVRLAVRYVEAGALGPSMRTDALHIAAATLAKVDVLVSWNFKHIVNHRRIDMFHAVNRRLGYATPDICSPFGLLDDVC